MAKRRARCTWTTVDTCGMYEFQTNEYEENRVLMLGKVFRTFAGYDRIKNAKRFWNNIKAINA